MGGDLVKRLAFVAALACVVAAVFGAALGHSFLPSHDDGPYLLWNPVLRAPLGQAIRGAFTTLPLGAWAPFHLLSHVLDDRLWGAWAGGYVLVNLLLHALDALLVAWLALRLGAPPLACATAALVFAVHPVQVESVVWISQRKTVLSLAFLLATLHLWISFAAAHGTRRRVLYVLSLDARDGDAAINAGAILLRREDVARALPLVEQGARLEPTSVEGQFNLGLARFLDGQLPGAERTLRDTASLDPAACAPQALLAHVLVLTGRPAEAIERYDALASRGCSDPENDLYRAFAESERGDREAATAALARALPAAGRLGPGFLRRPTLRVLRAQPRFEDLLRGYAGDRGRAAGATVAP